MENKKIIIVKNKLTGLTASCLLSLDGSPRALGLVSEEMLKEMAYKLGCPIKRLKILKYRPPK